MCAQLLRAGAHPAVDRRALGRGQLARHPPDLGRLDPARARHLLRRELAHERAHLVEPVGVLGEAARRLEPLLDERARHRREQQRVSARADEVMLVRQLRRPRATRIDHHDLPAALADAAQAPAHVRRGEQAAVRHERVRAEHQHVARRHLLRHLIHGRRRVQVVRARARASAPARGSERTGCARSGCRGRPRPRRGRAPRARATGAGRSPRRPRPSSPRPARRRAGRAASSAGPGPRAAP